MFLYNVTVKPNPDIAAEWLRWMQEVHIPELLQTGLFREARLCRLEDIDAEDGDTFAAQYLFASREDYDLYIANWAPQMRAKTEARFGGRFMAFRSVLAVLDVQKQPQSRLN